MADLPKMWSKMSMALKKKWWSAHGGGKPFPAEEGGRSAAQAKKLPTGKKTSEMSRGENSTSSRVSDIRRENMRRMKAAMERGTAGAPQKSSSAGSSLSTAGDFKRAIKSGNTIKTGLGGHSDLDKLLPNPSDPESDKSDRQQQVMRKVINRIGAGIDSLADYPSTRWKKKMKEEAEQVDEMDKSQPATPRGEVGVPTGSEAKPITRKKAVRDALKVLKKMKKEEVEQTNESKIAGTLAAMEQGRYKPEVGHKIRTRYGGQNKGTVTKVEGGHVYFKHENGKTYRTTENNVVKEAKDLSKELADNIRKEGGGKHTLVRNKAGTLVLRRVKKMKEEVEQMDEKSGISTPKLTSYVTRASDARGHRNLPTRKLDDRYRKIALATKTLDDRAKMKEEVEQMDEEQKKVPVFTHSDVRERQRRLTRLLRKRAAAARANIPDQRRDKNPMGTDPGAGNTKYTKEEVEQMNEAVGKQKFVVVNSKTKEIRIFPERDSHKFHHRKVAQRYADRANLPKKIANRLGYDYPTHHYEVRGENEMNEAVDLDKLDYQKGHKLMYKDGKQKIVRTKASQLAHREQGWKERHSVRAAMKAGLKSEEVESVEEAKFETRASWRTQTPEVIYKNNKRVYAKMLKTNPEKAERFRLKFLVDRKKAEVAEEVEQMDEGERMTAQRKAVRQIAAFHKANSPRVSVHRNELKKDVNKMVGEIGTVATERMARAIRDARKKVKKGSPIYSVTEDVEQMDEGERGTARRQLVRQIGAMQRTGAKALERTTGRKGSGVGMHRGELKQRVNKMIKDQGPEQVQRVAGYIRSTRQKLAKEDVEQMDEAVKTTHKNPLVTVHKGKSLDGHMNWTTARDIYKLPYSLDVEPLHRGESINTRNGHDGKPITIKLSRHHAKDVVKEDVEYIEEKLTAADPASKWISDFVKSDNPKFAGKSKKERMNMALGAYYAKKRANEEVVQEKLDPVGSETTDINNDKKVDKTDVYLHARRQKIGQAIAKKKGM